MNGFLKLKSETLPHSWWVTGSKRNKALLPRPIVYNCWQREAGWYGETELAQDYYITGDLYWPSMTKFLPAAQRDTSSQEGLSPY